MTKPELVPMKRDARMMERETIMTKPDTKKMEPAANMTDWDARMMQPDANMTDFGAGNNDLAYSNTLPTDKIKIWRINSE